jgi:orotate phosphoribosyltransferase
MTLIEHLLANGLLQFGRFQHNGVFEPFLSRLDMLGSYPDVLRALTDAAQHALAAFPRPERLLCTADALPLGIALALVLDTPLVYSRGRGEVPVDDLVGAYDIGHPTILIADTTGASVFDLAERAARVGLDVRAICTIIEIAPTPTTIPLIALIRLITLIDDPSAAVYLPTGQRTLVRAWLATQNATIG